MSEQQANPQATPSSTPAPEAPKVEAVSQESEMSDSDLSALEGSSSEGTKEAGAIEAAKDKVDQAKTKSEKDKAEKELEKAIHKYKLKVDGQEEDWEGTEEDLIRDLQLSRKARKEIKSSAELKKEAVKLVEMLRSNPKLVLKDFGVDTIEFAKQIIKEQIEEEAKSPDQRERDNLQRELEELREKNRSEAEQLKQEMYNRQVQQYEAQLEDQVQDALTTSGLPKSAYILKRMTDVMLSSLDNNKEITPKQAISIVRKEMQRDLKEMFGASPEDVLEEMLGQDTLKRLNKRQVDKIKASRKEAQAVQEKSKVVDTGTKNEPAKSEPAKKQTIQDWLNNKR